MLKKILLASTLLATSAYADEFTIGYNDSALDGQSSTFPPPHVFFQTAVTPDQIYTVGPFQTPGGFHYDQINAILRTEGPGQFRFDSGFNDGAAPGLGVSNTLTFSWQGATTVANDISLPSFFLVNEKQFGGAFLLYEQIYVCSGAQVFCNGAGFVDQRILTDISQQNVTLASVTPGQPFTVNEVFTWAMTQFGDGELPTNIGAGIGTSPVGVVNPVPGPEVGAGLPGLLSLLGMWWYRRRRSSLQVAT